MAEMREAAAGRRQQRAVALLHGCALLLLGMHLYARTLPASPDPVPALHSAETAWWGVWPATYLPLWGVWLGVLGVCAPIVWYWWGGRQTVSSSARRSWPEWLLPGVSVGLAVAFVLFPIAHTRWGDAFILAKGIAFPDPVLRLTRSWQAPLDVALHSQLWHLLHGPLKWEDAVPVYRWLSPLAGIVYLSAVLALSRLPLLAPVWLSYGLLVTLGLVQLFFGYIENYSFAAAAVLAYLWLALAVLGGRRPLWLAATVLALAHAFHPSTIVLAPSLLCLGWLAATNRSQSFLAVALQILLPMLAIGGAVWGLMEASGHGVIRLWTTDRPGGGDASWFVPLLETTTRWERYTMFSWPHLRDWLNNQLLVAPAVLPALLVAGLSLRGTPEEKSPLQRQAVQLLQLASGSYLLFTFVWNPDYGGQRDWDLFSLAALPTTVLLALWLPTRLPRPALWGGMLPLLALQAWHTAAWIYQNTLPWQWPDG